MLEPPFCRTVIRMPSSNPPRLNEPASASPAISPATSIRYTLPATIRHRNTLARVKDDPDIYHTTELRTSRLDEIRSYLWLAGLPNCARPLHRQRLLGREIVITEDPNEHLIWHRTRIFIKPLPIFLLDLDCWTRKICKSRQLHEAACGLLLSYAWLVGHESDLRIAHEKGLLPEFIDFTTWTELINEFLENIHLQSLSGVSPRYQYGELRLSRLNKIYRVTRFTWRDSVRGYMSTSTWCQDFVNRNFAWLLAVFAFMSVALSAMQVVLAGTSHGKAFENACYGFSIAVLFLVAGTVLVVFLIWAILFVYYLHSARMNNRRVMQERKDSIDCRKEP